MTQARAVFTLAVGRPIYLRMACALIRSYLLWNDAEAVPFFLATDFGPDELPPDLSRIPLIRLKPGQFGSGFSPKLHLDQVAPARQSLFVDADCLCSGSLLPAFEAFSGRSVSVIGREISGGEWFGDVASICGRAGIPSMARFNGGVYYLEAGEACTSVFEEARGLVGRYDEMGFTRLRGHPNDEVLLSVAMALHGQHPIAERGDIMNSLLAGPGGLDLDVLAGRIVLRNPRSHPGWNPWYEMEEMRPRLVHFLGSDIGEYPYRREEIRLALHCGRRWPAWMATLAANVSFSWPWLAWHRLKALLRPLAHAVAGPRAIRSSRADLGVP